MKGESVFLLQKEIRDYDELGAPIFEDKWVKIDDVLIGQPSTDDIVTTQQLYGKVVSYTLGIPKGDAHDWTDTRVRFWNDEWLTIGYPMAGTPENIPLRWGKNVKVEHYG